MAIALRAHRKLPILEVVCVRVNTAIQQHLAAELLPSYESPTDALELQCADKREKRRRQ